MAEYNIVEGRPFYGTELVRLKAFLKENSLDYDEKIQYTVELVAEDGDIIAAASAHNNVIKCVAISPDYQGQNLLAPLMSTLAQHFADEGIFHYFGFTKPKNKTVFTHMGLYPVAETESVLLLENKRDGFSRYVASLVTESTDRMSSGVENEKGQGIGAIVANCNPFTKGHRYLIEEAAKQCKWVHLFVLSTEQGWITSRDRYEMVRLGTEDLRNVILHTTSDYLISPVVFPTYFIKDKSAAFSMNCMLDVEIFRSHIAKALNITKRFVGTEPHSAVTSAYNEILKAELPPFDIAVTEIERCKAENAEKVISASNVRDAIKNKDFDIVKSMLPETSYKYLSEIGVIK